MKYENFVEQFFDIRTRTGEEVMVLCVHHEDRSASMQINLQSGLWLCFSCGASGGPKRLMEDQGVRFTEPEEDIEWLMSQLRKLGKDEQRHHERVYEESYLTQFDIPLPYWKEQRGLGNIAQKLFQLGYSPIQDCGTIPLRNMHGDLLGVIKRHFDPDAPAKYMYPKGFDRSSNLFGSWLVERDQSIDHVVLTEGSLDAIKLWQAGYPAMAIYGSSLTHAQVRLLKRLAVQYITLFFDDDAAGRKATRSCAGWKVNRRKGVETPTYVAGLDLSRAFNVRKVMWPEEPLMNFRGDNEAHDPGDLSSDQIDTLLAKTMPLS